jgi:dTDP-4-amino-4,6-dideoxygalactose transaminase
MNVDQYGNFHLQVARPRLPPAEALLPYLRLIDETRRYTNGGPLVRRLEARLLEAVRSADSAAAYVTSVASATTGLTIALQAAVRGRRGACLVPG